MTRSKRKMRDECESRMIFQGAGRVHFCLPEWSKGSDSLLRLQEKHIFEGRNSKLDSEGGKAEPLCLCVSDSDIIRNYYMQNVKCTSKEPNRAAYTEYHEIVTTPWEHLQIVSDIGGRVRKSVNHFGPSGNRLNHHWIDCHECLYRQSCSQEDKSYSHWSRPDSGAIMSLIFKKYLYSTGATAMTFGTRLCNLSSPN